MHLGVSCVLLLVVIIVESLGYNSGAVAETNGNKTHLKNYPFPNGDTLYRQRAKGNKLFSELIAYAVHADGGGQHAHKFQQRKQQYQDPLQQLKNQLIFGLQRLYKKQWKIMKGHAVPEASSSKQNKILSDLIERAVYRLAGGQSDEEFQEQAQEPQQELQEQYRDPLQYLQHKLFTELQRLFEKQRKLVRRPEGKDTTYECKKEHKVEGKGERRGERTDGRREEKEESSAERYYEQKRKQREEERIAEYQKRKQERERQYKERLARHRARIHRLEQNYKTCGTSSNLTNTATLTRTTTDKLQ